LAILLGRLPESVRIKKNLAGTTPPDIPVGLPSDILVRRPDILQASYLLKAQTERIGVAEALRLPAISLTGTLGVASTDLGAVTTEGGVWSIGGRLLGPIVDFGKNKRRVEIEEQRTQQALYQYENTVLTAFREVEDALVEIATYRNELAAVDRQQKAAKNANNLSKERYDKGVSSYLEGPGHGADPVFRRTAAVRPAAAVPQRLCQPLQGPGRRMGQPNGAGQAGLSGTSVELYDGVVSHCA
jgi:multidrug efflux system outer membrane protein